MAPCFYCITSDIHLKKYLFSIPRPELRNTHPSPLKVEGLAKRIIEIIGRRDKGSISVRHGISWFYFNISVQHSSVDTFYEKSIEPTLSTERERKALMINYNVLSNYVMNMVLKIFWIIQRL